MSVPVKNFMTSMPHSIGQDLPISKAKAMMAEFSCHHLPVLNGGHLVGVLSDRDLRQVEKVLQSRDVKVEEIMTDEPVIVQPDEDVFQVAMLMHQKKIGSVIVSATPSSKWGIFTATDALAYFSKSPSTTL